MDKIAVVILNYNGIKHLKRFLPYVEKYNSGYGIYIADSNSTDGSVAFLKENYAHLNLIFLKKNLGYAEGYNKTLRQIRAEYYILLNSDVEVTEGWVSSIIDYMAQNPDVAACQPKILSWHRKAYFEHAGAAGGFIDKWGYPFCRGRVFDMLEKDEGQYDNICEVFWASGACLFIRAEVFHAFGGFEPAFFAHMEEIDLCWRMKRGAWSVKCIPQSKVFHIGGGTLPMNTPFKVYLNFRNNLLMIYRNTTGIYRFQILVARFVLDLLVSFKYLRESFALTKSVFRAWVDFISMRKRLMPPTIIFIKKVKDIYKGVIVIDFYLKKRKKYSEIFNR